MNIELDSIGLLWIALALLFSCLAFGELDGATGQFTPNPLLTWFTLVIVVGYLFASRN